MLNKFSSLNTKPVWLMLVAISTFIIIAFAINNIFVPQFAHAQAVSATSSVGTPDSSTTTTSATSPTTDSSETSVSTNNPSRLQSLLATLQSLMAQVLALQTRLAQVQNDVQVLLKDNLKQGTYDSDVKKVQEVLATDPTIYPEGLTTGYFGSLTTDAVKRLQNRYGLAETGEIDKDTKDILEGFLSKDDNQNGNEVSDDLLQRKEIEDEVVTELCDNEHGQSLDSVCTGSVGNDNENDSSEDGSTSEGSDDNSGSSDDGISGNSSGDKIVGVKVDDESEGNSSDEGVEGGSGDD